MFISLVFGFVSVYAYYDMSVDARGGHNRKRVNENFFNTWSPSMAYVLGLIYADGSLIDSKKSSRCKYFKISSKDKDLIDQVKIALGSTHTIYVRPKGNVIIHGKKYLHSDLFTLRVGNEKMYKDLQKYGLTSNKSLNMIFPKVLKSFHSFFLRGYFDGDGCFSVSEKLNHAPRIQLIFTSGSYKYLRVLRGGLLTHPTIYGGSLCSGDRAFHLRYGKRDGLVILKYMYKHLNKAPYLKRKYKLYSSYMNNYK